MNSDRSEQAVERTARTQGGATRATDPNRVGIPNRAADTGHGSSVWAGRFALATLITAVPLIFFGGTVTTLHAGLAIDGWLVLEPGKGDWFLWAYPLEQWFRDIGTFVEHTHRLLGSAVGLLAIATVIAGFVTNRGGAGFKLSLAALSCVIVQGVLGGLRVLEKSEDLALVHGAFGQLTFALLCASVVATRPSWIAASSVAAEQGARLQTLSISCVSVVYSEIVVGAWLRHGGATLALFLHAVLVIAVVLCVMLLARELSRRAAAIEAPGTLHSLRRGLWIALGSQIALGLFAFLSIYVIVGKNPGSVQQSMFPTLHVMGGAALLSTSVAILLWSRKVPCAVRHARAAHEAREVNARTEHETGETLARAEFGALR